MPYWAIMPLSGENPMKSPFGLSLGFVFRTTVKPIDRSLAIALAGLNPVRPGKLIIFPWTRAAGGCSKVSTGFPFRYAVTAGFQMCGPASPPPEPDR